MDTEVWSAPCWYADMGAQGTGKKQWWPGRLGLPGPTLLQTPKEDLCGFWITYRDFSLGEAAGQRDRTLLSQFQGSKADSQRSWGTRGRCLDCLLIPQLLTPKVGVTWQLSQPCFKIKWMAHNCFLPADSTRHATQLSAINCSACSTLACLIDKCRCVY